jgi:hypothetical protein
VGASSRDRVLRSSDRYRTQARALLNFRLLGRLIAGASASLTGGRQTIMEVLLVEDDGVLRAVLAEALADSGMHVMDTVWAECSAGCPGC